MKRIHRDVRPGARWRRRLVGMLTLVGVSLWAVAALAETDVGPGAARDLCLSPDGDLPEPPQPAWEPAADVGLFIDPSALTAEAAAGGAPPPEGEPQAPAGDGPPIPLYTVEGTGGCLIVPMAYLVNPGPPGTKVGMPSVGYTFIKVGKTKSVQQVAVSETFYRRIELSYAMDTLDLGNFTDDVRAVFNRDIGDHAVLHNFNVRGLLIEETDACPAVTAGVTFKYNPSIARINRRLGGALTAMGVERCNGTDFTLHATKTFPTLGFGRPVILNAGIRFSQASQVGLLGFGDAYRMTGEGSVACFVTDWLAVAYEFRQKKDAIATAGDLVRGEDNWHTVCLAFILNEHLAAAVGWGHFGGVANEVEDGVWGFQVKYEF